MSVIRKVTVPDGGCTATTLTDTPSHAAI